MFRLTTACALLCGLWLSPATAQDQISGRLVDAAGNDFEYTFYLPKGYDEAGRAFPLVLNFGTAQPGMIAALQGEEFPAFLLAPRSQGFSWASPSEDLGSRSTLALQLMQQLESEYAVAPDRRYLTGLSNGGFGVFDMIAKRPDLFQAAAPVAAGYDPSRIAPSVRTWAFHGREDGVVNVNATRGMIQALHDAGADPLYMEVTKGAHDIWSDVYAMPEFYDWLLNDTQPPIAQLLYNPANGNLQVDPNPTPDGIWSFSLFSRIDLNESLIDEIAGTPMTNSTSRLRYRGDINSGIDGRIDFGNVLPAGLDYLTLPTALTAQYKSVGENANRDFIMKLVPEPSAPLLPAAYWVAVFFGIRGTIPTSFSRTKKGQ